MRLIVPMAGRGTRLRPHTHVTPKPLLPVVGIPMVERIVNTFTEVMPRPITEAVFVLGDFPHEVNDALTRICRRHGIEASFVYQDRALGTGHAVFCAKDYLEGEIISVFADTLFSMDGKAPIDGTDAVAWVKHVDDPRRFGVAVREADRIVAFVEKPQELISNEALIGIYYVKDGSLLRDALQRIMDENITGHGNEYQLTDAFDILLKKDLLFKTAGVEEWLDCGTIPAFMETSFHILQKEQAIDGSIVNAETIGPVLVADDATVTGSKIGPNVIIESGAEIVDSTLRDCIVFADARINRSTLTNAIVGHHASVSNYEGSVNIGDHASVG